MDSRSKFRPRLQCVNNSAGTQERYASGFVDWPFKDVGECKLAEIRVRGRRGNPTSKSRGVYWQEKLREGMLQVSVPQTDTGGQGE